MERFAKGLKAKLFFMVFYLYGYFGVGKICIENPVPSAIVIEAMSLYLSGELDKLEAAYELQGN